MGVASGPGNNSGEVGNYAILPWPCGLQATYLNVTINCAY